MSGLQAGVQDRRRGVNGLKAGVQDRRRGVNGLQAGVQDRRRALQIILDLCIPEIELANTRAQISFIFFQSHS